MCLRWFGKHCTIDSDRRLLETFMHQTGGEIEGAVFPIFTAL